MIVVNHHLLLSDLAVRRASGNWGEAAVLPAYTRLVVDEGHHLEDAAAAHLGTTVSRRSLQRAFNRLDRRGTRSAPARSSRACRSPTTCSARRASISRRRGSRRRCAPCARRARCCSTCSRCFCSRAARSVVRLTDDFAEHPIWDAGLRVGARRHRRGDRAARRRAAARARAFREF